MHDEIERLIGELELAPHPEGGWYRETYRSTLTVAAYGSPRAALTNIYFLLSGETFSAWHRIDADETWHFYRGTGLVIFVIGTDGRFEERVLGPDGPWQTTIPAGLLFASQATPSNGYALAGCSVAPGFEFAAFELPPRDALLASYPQHADAIRRLTRH
jgi:uncharacterized protein